LKKELFYCVGIIMKQNLIMAYRYYFGLLRMKYKNLPLGFDIFGIRN